MKAPAFFTTSLLTKPEALVLRGGARQRRLRLRVRVGYWHHPTLGHCLIDTGYSAHVTAPQRGQDVLLALYGALIRPSILTDTPLEDGLRRFGVTPNEIETVLLTHFHADHVGGLRDLPAARVICARAGWSALKRQSRLAAARHGVFASLLPQDLERRLRFFDESPSVEAPFGLGTGYDIAGDGTVLAVDLPGHLEGHVGLCFPRCTPPLLYGADIQWLAQAVTEDRCPGFPASLAYHDTHKMRDSVERARDFVRAGGDLVLCHDPVLNDYDVDREVGG